MEPSRKQCVFPKDYSIPKGIFSSFEPQKARKIDGMNSLLQVLLLVTLIAIKIDCIPMPEWPKPIPVTDKAKIEKYHNNAVKIWRKVKKDHHKQFDVKRTRAIEIKEGPNIPIKKVHVALYLIGSKKVSTESIRQQILIAGMNSNSNSFQPITEADGYVQMSIDGSEGNVTTWIG